MLKKIFQSPFVLALLVGVYPCVFYISTNWFMFSISKGSIISVAFSFIVFLVLGSYYVGVSWIVRKFSPPHRSARIIQRLFVLGSILMLIYLLRQTLSEMVGPELYIGMFVFIVLALVAWFLPKIQMYRVNIVLAILCVFNVGKFLYSTYTADAKNFVDFVGYEKQKHLYEQVKFSWTPNVYYIVPDGYPNQEALETIFDVDNSELYHYLESAGFVLYHSALSNYKHTIASISSSFGMGHHFYGGKIGNSELLDSRRFIVSSQNPVVRIFKNNGYSVHFIHETEHLLTSGCYVDECSPSVFLGGLIDVLIPPSLQFVPFGAKGKGHSHDEFRRRTLKQIEMISTDNKPYFTYIHTRGPSHSWKCMTLECLESFRNRHPKKLQKANDTIAIFVQAILTRDSEALIIINADHGAWGLGSYDHEPAEIFEGIEERLIGLDHLGVLLAIRWPGGSTLRDRNIRTNVNVFRYIFSYLSRSEILLASKSHDHGFLTKGHGMENVLMKVVHDGKILEDMVKVGPAL